MASAIETGLSLSLLPQFNYLCIWASCPWRCHWKIGRTLSAALCTFLSLVCGLKKLQKRKQASYVMYRGVSLKWNNTAVKTSVCLYCRIVERCLHLFSVFLHNTEGCTVGIPTWSRNVKCKHDFISKNAPLGFNSVILGLQPCFDCMTC